MRLHPAYTCLMGASLALAPAMAAADVSFPNDVAAADGAIRLEPVSPWNIDFGANRCRLTRVFGTEEDRHLLMLEQAAPNSEFGLTLAGSGISRFRTAATVDLGLERDEPMVSLDQFGKGEIADLGPALIFSTISIDPKAMADALRPVGVNLDEAAKVDRVVLRRGKAVLSFETGNMKDAIAALNNCTVDLLTQWGLDPEAHKNHVPPMWANAAAVTRRIVAVYPSSALRAGEQAIFRMRVTVETDGSVSDCLIEESTIAKKLESPACKEMRNAKFAPARDGQGQPMRSFYATTIRYVIGNR